MFSLFNFSSVFPVGGYLTPFAPIADAHTWQCISASDRRAEYCDKRVCVCLCVSVRDCDHIFGARPTFAKFFCMFPMAVARSSSSGVVIRYILPVLWITLSAKVARRRRPAEAQYTRSLGLGYKLCAIILVAGQRTHGTTFRALKVTSRVATPGAESAVYNCLVDTGNVTLILQP